LSSPGWVFAGIAAIGSEIVALPVSGVGLEESVTVTPNVNVPAVAGALLWIWPAAALLEAPAAESSVNPVGRELPFATAKVYGGVPPVTSMSAP
jgi:hypothetical protein